MKKSILIILSLSLGSFGLLYYYWNQFTNLPEWYTNKTETSTRIVDIRNPNKINEVTTQLEEKLESHLVARDRDRLSEQTDSDSPFNTRPIIGFSNNEADNSGVAIALNEKEFNALVVSNIVKKNRDRQFLESTEGVNTTIKNGSIEAGVVVNVSAIRPDKLADSEKDTLDRAIQTFPFLENREVYIALEGKPSLKNGNLNFDDTTRIKLGNVSMTLSELSKRLGIPKEQLEQKITLELHLGRLQINDIKFEGDRALIRGSVKENL